MNAFNSGGLVLRDIFYGRRSEKIRFNRLYRVLVELRSVNAGRYPSESYGRMA